MKVLLTGGTGYIGGAVLTELVAAGHEVVAAVRSDTAGQAVGAAGATAAIGDLTDVGWLSEQLSDVDAAIHTASPGDASSAAFDTAVADAVIGAFGGTPKPYLHTSGVWIWGNGSDLTEDGVLSPPDIVSWRLPLERRLLDSDVAVTLPAPGVVFGNRQGIVATLLPAGHDGVVPLVGTGDQHWTLVHVDDLAKLYVLLLQADSPAGHVLGVSGLNATVREIAAARSPQATLTPETTDESGARLGELFAEALLLDQQASGSKARSLGWTPRYTSLDDVARS
ncbi:NAD-dependent epimerase/dehydratase family protein [Gordonia sp. NB41Y]|uniref:NAD-dependent epimerase/dehydratase family protein n=1 Tax=Gordonia sp. NB41Y TaxID=875808 RepID=UPI0003485029|nr:NAD-dependent epimerase/dehydratase family protein [Gordonia sp. NB41Y]EMP12360.2 hypothetical protein ISGA_2411 [Gordonia sp. NB41Y]WLP92698.1 NAD-dependent epimerase/dehydratase family protein [Gordonia sp. NB41Y]